jgi:hypothetical protein
MTRIAVVYGVLAGAVTISSMITGMLLDTGHSLLLGYVIMLAALTLIFIGVKRYRDAELGGVIRFLPALGMGLGIAFVASLIYVAGWEIYMWATGYTFFASYANSVIAAKQAQGASPAEIAELTKQMAAMGQQYGQPLYRMVMTLFEILPVAVVVALISAALLRMRSFLPARAAAG